MVLDVVGRHALLFDDDAMAAFVNSPEALVDWNSLVIDRYDVRHLLSGPPPPRKRRRHLSSPSLNMDDTSESDLDRERYLDLPPPSPSPADQQDGANNEESAAAGGIYNAVSFSYGNTGESNEQKDVDMESSFRPPFPVPETLLQNLPTTEKVHQIMARTAIFVSKHGGQSEIILRVKQGNNPIFGFLMPDHQLHPYFRFLVDHEELLGSNFVDQESKADGAPDHASSVRGGALSLLGTVYGSGEDEDGETENATEAKRMESVEAGAGIDKTSTDGPQQKESSSSVNRKDDASTKHSSPLKEKASIIKRNQLITTVKAGTTNGLKKESDASAAEKQQCSSLRPILKVELPVVEPPSDLKRVVDKIVEFILRNGKQFEAVLAEQDVKHGRFPFLLPSNLYHPYYLEALKKAEKSKLPGKGFISEKHGSSGPGVEKKTASSRESDSASVGSDIPYNSDKKEKFKMVISKSKDGQDSPSTATQPQIGVSLDAAAAAAILQAATRGIKKPNLEILSKSSLNGSSLVLTSEGGHVRSFGSLHSSQPQSSEQKPGQKGEPSVSGPVASAIAKTAAIATASEADSSEACLTKEEKLKAERLKRAKMFTALIKTGPAPLKTEPLRGLSAEPPESGVCGSGLEGRNLTRKEREGSSAALDTNTCDKNEKHEKTNSDIDHNERRSKRKYRSRSLRHDADNGQEEEEEEKEEEKLRDGHSGKKQRSHHHSRDRRKNRKRHSSSKHRDSRHQHKHVSSTDDERSHKSKYSDSDHHRSRHRRKRDSSSDIEHQRLRCENEHRDSSEDEHRLSKHRHKHDSSSGDEYRYSRHRHKHHRSSNAGGEVELEEGEIYTKPDQSKSSEGNAGSREASADISNPDATEGRALSMLSTTTTASNDLKSTTTTASNDLRAKIRAMLMATL